MERLPGFDAWLATEPETAEAYLLDCDGCHKEIVRGGAVSLREKVWCIDCGGHEAIDILSASYRTPKDVKAAIEVLGALVAHYQRDVK